MLSWRLFLFFVVGICFSLSAIGQDLVEKGEKQQLGRQALAEIRRDINLSQQQIEQLTGEIERLGKDQISLSEALIASASQIEQFEMKLAARQERLGGLLVQKNSVRQALDRRRYKITTTLAVLERLGLRPPPALLVPLDETLDSLRSSGLLGTMIVHLQAQAQALREGFKKIEQIEQLIAEEKTQIEADLRQSQIENKRLVLLLDAKKNAQQQSEGQLISLQERASILARRAHSLQDLIDEMEKTDFDAASNPMKNEQQTGLPTNLLPIDNHFTRRRGQLTPPVSGIKVQAFDKGHHGELYKTRSGAIVTAPANGVVRYAGLFRSYGQLLIIDVGQDYHFVLAGMEQMHVKQGQIVLVGEPIGAMPILPDDPSEQLSESMPIVTERETGEQAVLTLYIELRKDGVAIDPAPWWRRASNGADI